MEVIRDFKSCSAKSRLGEIAGAAFILLSWSACFVSPGTSGTASLQAPARMLDAGSAPSGCGGGLTGAIAATSSSGPLPGVAQYGCASTAVIPPFKGPDASFGGSGQTFSFGAAATSAPTLNGTMTFQITGTAPGAYDISTLSSYVMYGYLNSGYCASVTGSITISALGPGSGAGTFTASALCDSAGTVQYSNVSGSFHIP